MWVPMVRFESLRLLAQMCPRAIPAKSGAPPPCPLTPSPQTGLHGQQQKEALTDTDDADGVDEPRDKGGAGKVLREGDLRGADGLLSCGDGDQMSGQVGKYSKRSPAYLRTWWRGDMGMKEDEGRSSTSFLRAASCLSTTSQ